MSQAGAGPGGSLEMVSSAHSCGWGSCPSIQAFMCGRISSIHPARRPDCTENHTRFPAGQSVTSRVPRSPGFWKCQCREPGKVRKLPLRRICNPYCSAASSIKAASCSSLPAGLTATSISSIFANSNVIVTRALAQPSAGSSDRLYNKEQSGSWSAEVRG